MTVIFPEIEPILIARTREAFAVRTEPFASGLWISQSGGFSNMIASIIGAAATIDRSSTAVHCLAYVGTTVRLCISRSARRVQYAAVFQAPE